MWLSLALDKRVWLLTGRAGVTGVSRRVDSRVALLPLSCAIACTSATSLTRSCLLVVLSFATSLGINPWRLTQSRKKRWEMGSSPRPFLCGFAPWREI